MRLLLFSVRPGRAHGPEFEAPVQAYLARIASPFRAASRVLRAETPLLEAAAAERKAAAAAIWLADSRGKLLSSEQLAAAMQQMREAGKRTLVLAIGPADGWSSDGRAAADLLLSLGPMTLPHDLARLVLAEQMYRATTILAGHPYHLGHG